nr:YdiU family protein [Lysobacter sp.]
FYDGNAKAEPGAVVCRVAPSFIRFGNFELPASRGDVALLRQLVDFCIGRDFPHLASLDLDQTTLYAVWFREVCERTAVMVGHWMRVGFVHGVMNTDNMSILGLTIDYGPYGWIDNYDPDWTPNTTDIQNRRYRFGQQPQVAYWNLGRLAGALSPLFPDTAPLQAGLQHFVEVYSQVNHHNATSKLGLDTGGPDAIELMDALLQLMSANEVDMTLFFRALADVDLSAPSLDPLRHAFYDPEQAGTAEADFLQWLSRYAARVEADPLPPAARRAQMLGANPRYVLRNYLAQQAIDRAEQGDASGVMELLDVMRHPYDELPGREQFAQRRPDWARQRAGCSMLSCSS